MNALDAFPYRSGISENELSEVWLEIRSKFPEYYEELLVGRKSGSEVPEEFWDFRGLVYGTVLDRFSSKRDVLYNHKVMFDLMKYWTSNLANGCVPPNEGAQ